MTLTDTRSLYFEVRGSGDPLLLIPGTPGDGGQFEALAETLADRHTVVTYDRAGASRSRQRPVSSVAEHADDAAGLLRNHTDRPAVVYGTSNGALVALELALRHPSLIAQVVIHEPPLLSVLAEPEPVAAMIGEVVGQGMEQGGPAAGLEAFLRFAFGDAVVDARQPELRDRMLANAESVFTVELPIFQAYRPDETALGSISVPLVIAVGEDQQAPFFLEAAGWLATQVGDGIDITRTPGAHGPHFTCPDALAAMLF